MTRETSIYWPDSLGCPLRQSYVGQADPLFATTEVADGPPRFRLLASDERRMWSLTFTWTADQVATFEGWVALDLDMGLSWFRMDQLTGSGMVEHFCHLVGDYSIRATQGTATHFDVTFDVEAYLNAHALPPPFEFDGSLDAREVSDTPPADVVDARAADEARPGDRTDALVPGA